MRRQTMCCSPGTIGVFRPPPTAHIAWALMDDEHRLVLESCQDTAVDKR
ncbi:hypothetical protein [Streptomyces uncialis]